MFKKFLTNPLELKKKESKEWQESGYKCVAIIDDDKNNIKKSVILHTTKLFDMFDEAIAVIWFFDGGISQDYYVNLFNSLNLIAKTSDYMLYKVTNVFDIEKLVANWGEYASLDIIFPKVSNERIGFLPDGFYKNFNCYRKDFMIRVIKSEAIISDSGDGEEAQFIFSNNTYNIIDSKFHI